MGCGASVHTSESQSCLVEQGAESTDSERISEKRIESASLSGVVGHLDQLEETLKEALKAKRLSMEAETQTQEWRQATAGGTGKRRETKRDVDFGPIKLTQPPMQILLVFAREDAQSDAFWWAAERGGYSCDIAVGASAAIRCFLQKHHELVIIDLRYGEALDGLSVCRELLSVRQSEYTVTLGITLDSREDHAVDHLLSVGFNRIFVENHDIGSCQNELVMLERGEVLSRFKQLSVRALWEAVDNCLDGIEITTPDAEYQYVNPAFERMCGYTRTELVGRYPREMVKSDLNKPEVFESMNEALASGHMWKGQTFGGRKNGDSYPQDVRIVPVFAPSGRIIHHVGIKRDISQQVEAHDNLRQVAKSIAEVQEVVQHHYIEPSRYSQRNGQYYLSTPKRKMSPTVVSPHNIGVVRESVVQEAPITKVMNMLNKAQEQSPQALYQSLENAMDLLRSTELYLPWQTGMMTEVDPRTRDFVGGLMGPSRHKLSMGSSSDVRSHAPSSPKLPKLPDLSAAPKEVQLALQGCDRWDFKILELEDVSDHGPLYWLGQRLFGHFEMNKVLNVSENTLRHWLQLMERNYHSTNTYHNSTHAADVLHAASHFLEKTNVKELLDPLDVAAVLIAAVVHDVNHPGRTNSFLCSSGDELAILYNDISVLESHHAAFAFRLTTTTRGCNIFKGLPPDDYRSMRQSVVDMVLATDMTKHFEYLKKFENLIKVSPLVEGEQPQITATTEVKVAAKRILIKTADIGNPCRPEELCVKWAKRIAEEYFKQTEEEKRQGLPVNLPVFDRGTCNIPKSQVQFIEYFVLDLFSAWDLFADISEPMDHLRSNYQYWKDEAAAEEEKRKRILNHHGTSMCRPSPDDSGRGMSSTTSLDQVPSS